MHSSQEIDHFIEIYREGLLEDTLPFWIQHSVDREYGGFLFSLDRDGTVISPDKSVWIHGRFTWLLATLYADVEPREEWLELARHGIEFLRRHCFDTDGRMFFSVTREGRPLRKRRYIFSETFAVIALAACARASGDEAMAREALELFKHTLHYLQTPGLLPPKVNPETRPSKGLGVPMILIATAQELRKAIDDPLCTEWINRCIEEIERDFMKKEFECLLETVGPDGAFLDTFEGRMICPGHSIEAAWFILQESKNRGNDPELRNLGLQILDWSWQWGWDEEYGGIIYYRDAKNLPPTEYWHDMKFWWPQNETIIATLLAWQLTGDEKYARRHRQIHDWTYDLFPDPEYGEWFGYFHRDGRRSTSLKGNTWKGPFHLPRMQLICWKILEEMKIA